MSTECSPATHARPQVRCVPFIHPETRGLVMLRLNRRNALTLQRYYRAREQALQLGSSEPLRPFRHTTVRDLRLTGWVLDCDLDSILAAMEALTDEEGRELEMFLSENLADVRAASAGKGLPSGGTG